MLRLRTDDDAAGCLWNILQDTSIHRLDVVQFLGFEEFAENILAIWILAALAQGDYSESIRLQAISSLEAILSTDVDSETRGRAMHALDRAKRPKDPAACPGCAVAANNAYVRLVKRGVFSPALVQELAKKVPAPPDGPSHWALVLKMVGDAQKMAPPPPAPTQPKLGSVLDQIAPGTKVPKDPNGEGIPGWKIAVALLGTAALATGVVVAYKFWAKPPQIESRRYV
jgi:hypothetical protein